MTLKHSKNKFSSKPIAAAITAVLSTYTQAQDIKELDVTKATTQSDSSYVVEKSSSHKYSQPLLDTAKTITVINKALMKDRNIDSLGDALRSVSGISLAAGEGGAPPGDSLTIRGFSATTDIFVDGMRDIAGYSRDTYNVESIEVSKGPSSAVSGRGSTGGSINLETKTATLDQFTDLSARIGNASDVRIQVDSNLQIDETTALRVNVLVDDGDVAGRDEIENRKKAIAGSLATGLGTKSRFTLNVDYEDQDNIPDYGIPWVSNSATSDPVAELADYEGSAPPVDFDNFYGNINRDYEEIEVYSATARYEYDMSESTTLRAQARVGAVSRESVVTAPRFIDLTTSTDVRLSDEKTRDTKDSLTALQFDLIGEYDVAGFTHNLVTGVELAKEDHKRWAFVDLIDDNLDSTPELNDLYNPNAEIAFTGAYGRDGTSIEAKSTNTAIYVFDTVTLNKQWEVSAGLRFDQFDVDYQYDYSDPSLSLDTSDSLFSWNLDVVYKPSENSSVYFGAGNSHSPSAEDLTVSTRRNEADLDPEETTSYEMGAKWLLLDDKLALNTAIFKTIKDNARSQVDADTFELTGKNEVQGIEFSAIGQVTPELSVTFAYTYQDSEVSEESEYNIGALGQELARTPNHTANLWAKYQFNDKLSAGFGAQFVDERYNNTNALSREIADDYLIFDVMVAYQASERVSIQLNAENLTDEDYEDDLGGGHFIPGVGRYITLTGTYSF
ncbi:TonB-dependent receptor [Pseudocolwellia sp. HL-MZ7]|uniref:TonB-dependent receptor n=1 Tax=Pseudocolwellia sp. HL-MZ7 TaxID=3400627 RepID=UPI003CF67575